MKKKEFESFQLKSLPCSFKMSVFGKYSTRNNIMINIQLSYIIKMFRMHSVYEDLKLSPIYTYKKEYNINVKSISQGFAFIR